MHGFAFSYDLFSNATANFLTKSFSLQLCIGVKSKMPKSAVICTHYSTNMIIWSFIANLSTRKAIPIRNSLHK